MESSSKICGDEAEECQSSESGWTMYIGSSIDDGGLAGSGVSGAGAGRKTAVVDEDGDTDDSMASDASSGPGQQETEGKYNSSSRKYKKAVAKTKGGVEEGRKEDKKEDSLVNDQKGVVCTVQSANRAWFLGRKK